jgi:heat shock protein HslJ
MIKRARSTRRAAVAALVILASTFVATQPASAAGPDQTWPAGTQYQSTRLRDRADSGPAAGAAVRLTFGEGDVIGFTGGCNSYGGHGVIENGHLRLTSDLTGTLMLCSDDLMKTEAWFAGLLQAEPEFRLRSGGRLELRDDAARAEFVAS